MLRRGLVDVFSSSLVIHSRLFVVLSFKDQEILWGFIKKELGLLHQVVYFTKTHKHILGGFKFKGEISKRLSSMHRNNEATLTLTLPLSFIVVFDLFPWQNDLSLVIQDTTKANNSQPIITPFLFSFYVFLAACFICHIFLNITPFLDMVPT